MLVSMCYLSTVTFFSRALYPFSNNNLSGVRMLHLLVLPTFSKRGLAVWVSRLRRYLLILRVLRQMLTRLKRHAGDYECYFSLLYDI